LVPGATVYSSNPNRWPRLSPRSTFQVAVIGDEVDAVAGETLKDGRGTPAWATGATARAQAAATPAMVMRAAPVMVATAS
jgi:hypothetical protein